MAQIGPAKNLKALTRGARTVMVVATARTFAKNRFPRLLGKRDDTLFTELAKEASVGDQGGYASTLTGRQIRSLAVGVLPNTVSRYNTPSQPQGVRQVVAQAAGGKGKLSIILVLQAPEHLNAALNAVGRAFPKYSAKSGKRSERRVQLWAVDPKGTPIEIPELALMRMEAARDSAELVDTPPTELNPAAFAERVRATFKGVKAVKVKEIAGDKLLANGLGGIHAVGRAALNAPRMVVCEYTPANPSKRHVALVGKGVTYDTGGLHLKMRGFMEGMKSDMGGAAAMFGAFRVLVAGECAHRISLVLCMAENAISAASYKPDDIITMHSGKTVEINNTDAEGRLLLADGVSYAARELGADTIFDAATLTGAQLISTGLVHAAVVSNDEELEAATIAAGKRSGDLCHPLIFAPELLRKELSSVVADMCNSVHNRMNAQSSCAAQFVYAHIADTRTKWCHVDLAGPAFPKDRGSGYGVALVAETVDALR